MPGAYGIRPNTEKFTGFVVSSETNPWMECCRSSSSAKCASASVANSATAIILSDMARTSKAEKSSSSLRLLQFVHVRHRHAQRGDFLFLLDDQRIELRNLDRVLPLLVLTEAEQVRLVLWPPAVEIETI